MLQIGALPTSQVLPPPPIFRILGTLDADTFRGGLGAVLTIPQTTIQKVTEIVSAFLPPRDRWSARSISSHTKNRDR